MHELAVPPATLPKTGIHFRIFEREKPMPKEARTGAAFRVITFRNILTLLPDMPHNLHRLQSIPH
jgi:hypothetical protein